MQTVHREDSYYEEYKRSQPIKLKKGGGATTQQLMTDRNAYMAFLETELERVSSACMTVQSYKQRLSDLDSNQQDMDEKLKRYSRALKLSSTMTERVESESRHKLENLEARLAALDKRQTLMETDCKLFVNGDMPSLRDEVRQTVKRQLVEMTAKYNEVEQRCNDLINERLDGYTEVYSALEKKLTHVLTDNLTSYAEKMNANNDAIKEWTRKTLERHLESVRNVEQNVTRRIETLQHQILEEQPKYLEGVISKNLRSMALDTENIKQRVDQKLNLQNQSAERAELTCSKIADDVYKRLQSQRCDLFEHIKHVELRITSQLKEAIAQFRDDREPTPILAASQRMERKRSRSIGAAVDHDRGAQSTISALRDQMLDYRSEMIHSQQKLREMEQKLKRTEMEETAVPASATNKGLAELDRKYSSIQTSITGLQAMMSEHSAPRKKGNKKKKKKRRKSMVSSAVASAQLLTGSSQDFVPSHLTPHLSDLDNLVQCVFEADQLDKRHSSGKCNAGANSKTAKLNKKRKSQTALLRKSCPSCVRPSCVRPSSAKKKGALWK